MTTEIYISYHHHKLEQVILHNLYLLDLLSVKKIVNFLMDSSEVKTFVHITVHRQLPVLKVESAILHILDIHQANVNLQNMKFLTKYQLHLILAVITCSYKSKIVGNLTQGSLKITTEINDGQVFAKL
jgi:hypothetical protein